jgi:hypothetical protein
MPSTKPFVELGVTGLRRTGGSYAAAVDNELSRDLRGDRARKVYREMRDNDPIVGAIVYAIEMLMRRVKWRVDSASDAPEDKDYAEFVEQCLGDTSHTFEDFISECLSMLAFGYSVFEIVYKRREGPGTDGAKRSRYTDGRIGWRKWAVRAQESLSGWDFDDEGGVAGVQQIDPVTNKTINIPIEKLLLFRTTSDRGNPEGRSILRNSYTSWFYKKRIQEYEGIGIERDLAGYPVVRIPGTVIQAAGSALSAWQQVARDIRRDEQEGLVIPSDRDESGNLLYDVTLISSSGTRAFDTNEIINRYDSRIAMTVLADFVLLGHEQSGSWSLASSKTSLFSTAVGGFLGQISSVINKIAVPRLFALNGWTVEEYPKLCHGDIETPDLEALGNYIQKLSGAGAPLFPDDALENYLRVAANLPERPEGEMAPLLPGRVAPKPPPAGDEDLDVEETV